MTDPTTIILPCWFATLVAILVLIPAVIGACGATAAIHYVYNRIFRRFRQLRKAYHTGSVF